MEKRWVSKNKKAIEDLFKQDEDEVWAMTYLECKTLPEIVRVGAKYRPFADGGSARWGGGSLTREGPGRHYR